MPECPDEDRRAGDAVDVIVAVDDDALASCERTPEAIDRAIQIAHRRTVIARARCQERRHVGVGDAARAQDLGDEARDTIEGSRFFRFRQDPVTTGK